MLKLVSLPLLITYWSVFLRTITSRTPLTLLTFSSRALTLFSNFCKYANKSIGNPLSSLNPDNILSLEWKYVTPLRVTLSSKCSSKPLADNSEFIETFKSSLSAALRIKSFSLTTLLRLSGNSIVITSLNADSTGDSGQPTSEIEAILISTLSFA